MIRILFTILFTELLQIKKDQRTITAMCILPILMIPAILALIFTEEIKQDITCIIRTNTTYENLIANTDLTKKYNFIPKDITNQNQQDKLLLIELNNNEILLLVSSSDKQLKQINNDFSRHFLQYPELKFDVKTNLPIEAKTKRNLLDNKLENVYSGLYTVIIIFLIVCFSGPALVSSDITAGEKERKTLEALLMTKCPVKYIVLGKYLTILLFSIIPLISGILIMYCFGLYFNVGQSYYPNISFVIKLILPYCIFMSAFLLRNGLKAKTIRAAKSTESLFFVFILLANIFMIMNNINLRIIHIIPILNTIYYSLNNVLMLETYLLYLTAYLFFSYLSLKKSVKLLSSENVLYSDN